MSIVNAGAVSKLCMPHLKGYKASVNSTLMVHATNGCSGRFYALRDVNCSQRQGLVFVSISSPLKTEI